MNFISLVMINDNPHYPSVYDSEINATELWLMGFLFLRSGLLLQTVLRISDQGWLLDAETRIHCCEFTHLLSTNLMRTSRSSWQVYKFLQYLDLQAHMSPDNGTKFNFQKYIHRSLEEDFKVIVGIRCGYACKMKSTPAILDFSGCSTANLLIMVSGFAVLLFGSQLFYFSWPTLTVTKTQKPDFLRTFSLCAFWAILSNFQLKMDIVKS